MPAHLNNLRPDFTKRKISCGSIPAYQFSATLADELSAKHITKREAVELLEDMLIVREFEEMIVKLRSGAYPSCAGFEYRGPTHVSIGQEACSVGGCTGIAADDYITSTHRGHGDSVAKGCVAIRKMDAATLRARLPGATGTTAEIYEAALEDHIFRTAAELFGKEEGYCKGRGGSMHIADFSVGHLGANAIVGGGVPIATGAAWACRYLRNGRVAVSFAGDGAYSNGVVLESLNWAAQYQFTNLLAKDHRFGLPMIFVIQNNHYGMTGRADNEVAGVEFLARRAAGFDDHNMHAEVVNGMDVLAVREAMQRAAALCREGRGPCLLELSTYRYYGHSLSDPRNEYRTKDEESAWKDVDPIKQFSEAVIAANVLTRKGVEALTAKVEARNARAAARASKAMDPSTDDVLKHLYSDLTSAVVPAEFQKVEIVKEKPVITRTNGQLTYKDALKEALLEEMLRDNRVVVYGEDVAEYGGAFKVTKGLLEAFGRERVFNTPISEAAICSTAVGSAMLGLRPVIELMYMDFSLMSGDAIGNQAAKWHYMSGAKAEIAMVIRASVGGGKGYGGQHSQTLESIFAHIPGLYVVYPATPRDAKGMLKTAIRDNNPILFVESQLLYMTKGEVPEDPEFTIPFGLAEVKREGKDISFIVWGPALHDALKAADELAKDGVQAEVVDLRSLVPLDMQTVLRSVRKTGKVVVGSQCVTTGSFMGEIIANIQHDAFDALDAPIQRVGARDTIAPQSSVLEAAFLPTVKDFVAAARAIL
ncbi:MAG: dehydrogenase E1 component subunit alpha/beta [bacterium]